MKLILAIIVILALAGVSQAAIANCKTTTGSGESEACTACHVGFTKSDNNKECTCVAATHVTIIDSSDDPLCILKAKEAANCAKYDKTSKVCTDCAASHTLKDAETASQKTCVPDAKIIADCDKYVQKDAKCHTCASGKFVGLKEDDSEKCFDDAKKVEACKKYKDADATCHTCHEGFAAPKDNKCACESPKVKGEKDGVPTCTGAAATSGALLSVGVAISALVLLF